MNWCVFKGKHNILIDTSEQFGATSVWIASGVQSAPANFEILRKSKELCVFIDSFVTWLGEQ